MTAAEIEQTVADFAGASALAAQAGYDGVEIMGSEGYLITQFLALRTNQRSDAWGGPLENRMRFATEIVKRTRAATTPRSSSSTASRRSISSKGVSIKPKYSRWPGPSKPPALRS
jgi:2,4-dienoyl-CoA reductase (NADPH2)